MPQRSATHTQKKKGKQKRREESQQLNGGEGDDRDKKH
jgi:hypothetical protein